MCYVTLLISISCGIYTEIFEVMLVQVAMFNLERILLLKYTQNQDFRR